ncbi:hypothetical protein CXF36_04670 [Corynebacterium bovis]|nr:hypothetical protein CXF36_04670 [Corynebacterium bovis]
MRVDRLHEQVTGAQPFVRLPDGQPQRLHEEVHRLRRALPVRGPGAHHEIGRPQVHDRFRRDHVFQADDVRQQRRGVGDGQITEVGEHP